jgi:hypothetical protein
MLGRNGGTDPRVRRIAFMGVALLVVWMCAGASPAPAGAHSGDVAAVWVSKEVEFQYVGFTTKYSCDGLQERVRGILLQLGARDDLKVTPYGCVRVTGPETSPGVRIVMHVLQPAAATAGQTVAAHWESVDALPEHDPVKASLDCELIAQLHGKVLPLFTARQIDYSATCSVNQPLTGGTRLKADVLVADAAPGAAATR